jgi:hypothetical protein
MKDSNGKTYDDDILTEFVDDLETTEAAALTLLVGKLDPLEQHEGEYKYSNVEQRLIEQAAEAVSNSEQDLPVEGQASLFDETGAEVSTETSTSTEVSASGGDAIVTAENGETATARQLG